VERKNKDKYGKREKSAQREDKQQGRQDDRPHLRGIAYTIFGGFKREGSSNSTRKKHLSVV